MRPDRELLGWALIALVVAGAGWGFRAYEHPATPQMRQAPTDEARKAPVLHLDGGADHGPRTAPAPSRGGADLI